MSVYTYIKGRTNCLINVPRYYFKATERNQKLCEEKLPEEAQIFLRLFKAVYKLKSV